MPPSAPQLLYDVQCKQLLILHFQLRLQRERLLQLAWRWQILSQQIASAGLLPRALLSLHWLGPGEQRSLHRWHSVVGFDPGAHVSQLVAAVVVEARLQENMAGCGCQSGGGVGGTWEEGRLVLSMHGEAWPRLSSLRSHYDSCRSRCWTKNKETANFHSHDLLVTEGVRWSWHTDGSWLWWRVPRSQRNLDGYYC